jgi:hypothetical protein
MTNKWTVNGVEAPEGAEFYCAGLFYKKDEHGNVVYFERGWWHESTWSITNRKEHESYQPRPQQLSRIDIIATNGNDGEHYNDYAFCLSEAIKKLKHCADVAPDDKRKDALLEIVDEVEFIKSEGIGDE